MLGGVWVDPRVPRKQLIQKVHGATDQHLTGTDLVQEKVQKPEILVRSQKMESSLINLFVINRWCNLSHLS